MSISFEKGFCEVPWLAIVLSIYLFVLLASCFFFIESLAGDLSGSFDGCIQLS